MAEYVNEKAKQTEFELRGEKNAVLGGRLYIVATPIGNLSDISQRALKVLDEVDFIAAEDTRNSLRLLRHFGISTPLVSYHEHNKRHRGAELVERMRGGEACALITDAGTPAISDPGEDLVMLCAEQGIPVTSIPGACALINALTLSALPTARFVFEGFLPVTGKERRERLESLREEERTFILHEAPHKLITTLKDLEEYLGGDRRISICRELTKLNEEVIRTTIGEARSLYSQREPRGEYVLVIDGAVARAERKDPLFENATPEEVIRHFTQTGLTKNQAIKAAAKALDIPRNELYRITLEK